MRRRAEDYPIPTSHDGPVGMAHKQLSAEAIIAARDKGITNIEFDLCVSRDKIPFLNHPSWWNEPGWLLKDLKLSEISAMRGEEQLTFEEALTDSEFDDIFYDVEPKLDAVVWPMTEVIRKTRSVGRLSVGSFSVDRTKEAAALLGKGLATTYFAVGASALKGFGKKDLGLVDKFLARPDAMEFAGFEIPHNLISVEEIDKLHELGFWTLSWAKMGSRKKHDNRQYLEDARDKGFPVIISDRVDDMVDVLSSRRQGSLSIPIQAEKLG